MDAKELIASWAATDANYDRPIIIGAFFDFLKKTGTDTSALDSRYPHRGAILKVESWDMILKQVEFNPDDL